MHAPNTAALFKRAHLGAEPGSRRATQGERPKLADDYPRERYSLFLAVEGYLPGCHPTEKG